jgi:predicted RNA binding protein YcfA (HicA-like mRNA interferase family)
MSGRLPSCTARDVEKALIKKGLLLAHQKGSHRYYADPVTGQVVTTVPMHPGDLPRWLLKKIIKDVGLSEDEFRGLL